MIGYCMTTHKMRRSATRVLSYKKSMITAIIALLLICSVSTLGLSPFQKASAQKTLPSNRPLPGQEQQQQTTTTTSDAASNKAQEAFNSNNRLPTNTNQGQQPPQLEPEENVGNTVNGLQNKITNAVEQLVELERRGTEQLVEERKAAPIATSGNNVYLVWPSNKTTADFEIMFKASTDGGKTFGPKINLSNSTGIDSERPQIAAAGNNVYVTWWERANSTSNEPVMRISNDNGKTFGDRMMLSMK